MAMDNKPAEGDLSVRFWGVRGSHPVSGLDVCAFGGHTACVEVRCGERLFVIDAGTGITRLGQALGADAPAQIDLLLSHLHLDHVIGLPFFRPALMKGTTLRLYCGNLGGETAEVALDRLFAPPLFPVKLAQLPATIEHVGFHAGETLTFDDGVEVRTCPLQHPSGATAYRFDHRGRSVCYVSDIEHDELGPWPHEELLAFVRDADLVIYDAMYTEAEYCRCRGWGHSTCDAGVALCRAAGVGRLAAFHLHPWHTDADLADMERRLDMMMPGSFVAREGQEIHLAAARAAA
ncbi:MAG: MBL fold metallo-hydrolase [Pseudomonadota bacterium]